MNQDVSALILKVTGGRDEGRQWDLPVGAFRVVGRAEGAVATTEVVAISDRRRLNAEDQALVSSHLRERAQPDRPGTRAELTRFERLPDATLDDDAVSDAHAMIFLDEAGISVVDAGATNGTWVNGERISRRDLVPGDLLRIGESRLKILKRKKESPAHLFEREE
jgi:hypothetical protein